MQKPSPWANTRMVDEIKCTKCGAEAGEPCVTPQKRRCGLPHVQRSAAYIESIGRDEFDRRHSFTIPAQKTTINTDKEEK